MKNLYTLLQLCEVWGEFKKTVKTFPINIPKLGLLWKMSMIPAKLLYAILKNISSPPLLLAR